MHIHISIHTPTITTLLAHSGAHTYAQSDTRTRAHIHMYGQLHAQACTHTHTRIQAKQALTSGHSCSCSFWSSQLMCLSEGRSSYISAQHFSARKRYLCVHMCTSMCMSVCVCAVRTPVHSEARVSKKLATYEAGRHVQKHCCARACPPCPAHKRIRHARPFPCSPPLAPLDKTPTNPPLQRVS